MNTVACELCGFQYAAGLARCPSCGTGTAAPAHHLPAGTSLQGGRFTVGRVLGRGGFGITYKGAHRRLRRPVAVKELFPEFASRTGLTVTVPADQRAGFQREQASVVQEAQVLASLEAPGIVGVHDFFEENGTTYIVLEYLEGPTLEEEIDRLDQLPHGEVFRVAEQICEALETVHGANLLHRDIKPANILLTRDGRVVLIDFGSARAYEAGKTQHRTIRVTPNYAAPEQFSPAARFGPYTDVFSLGATLYHALIGMPPEPALQRLQAQEATVSLPPSVPKGLQQAVQAALHGRIEDRPANVAEFRNLLGAARPSVRQPRPKAVRPAASGASPVSVPYQSPGRLRHTLKSTIRDFAILLFNKAKNFYISRPKFYISWPFNSNFVLDVAKLLFLNKIIKVIGISTLAILIVSIFEFLEYKELRLLPSFINFLKGFLPEVLDFVQEFLDFVQSDPFSSSGQ